MKVPILRGERLTLRPITIADAPIFIRWLSDRQVTRYLLTQKTPTLSEEKKWIRSVLHTNSQQVWSIIDENGLLVGNTGLRVFPKDKRANFGIMIGEKTSWGKGYAGEVLKLLFRYTFKTLKYDRFELEVNMENKRGLRAYQKAGLILEGVRRKYRLNMVTRKIEDCGIMSILRKDWLHNHK